MVLIAITYFFGMKVLTIKSEVSHLDIHSLHISTYTATQPVDIVSRFERPDT